MWDLLFLVATCFAWKVDAAYGDIVVGERNYSNSPLLRECNRGIVAWCHKEFLPCPFLEILLALIEGLILEPTKEHRDQYRRHDRFIIYNRGAAEISQKRKKQEEPGAEILCQMMSYEVSWIQTDRKGEKNHLINFFLPFSSFVAYYGLFIGNV